MKSKVKARVECSGLVFQNILSQDTFENNESAHAFARTHAHGRPNCHIMCLNQVTVAAACAGACTTHSAHFAHLLNIAQLNNDTVQSTSTLMLMAVSI